ncbi:MAG: OmpA family protein [Bacteroidetes bacterium]|nr:MAG: OmpA family protein [Bacteroidota bacterium]
MLRPILVLVVLSWVGGLSAQRGGGLEEGENLVPNPGFEQYSSPPIGWFYKGEHYTRVMKYWSSATVASPDVFGPRVRVPSHWAEKGFGQQQPHGGHSMSGITLFGCEQGKPHCREYIQVQLLEPLVVGQTYRVEMWVSHLPRSLQINGLGFAVSEEPLRELTDGPLSLIPVVFSSTIIKAPNHRWIKIGGHFQAESPANYLIIGNFFPDSLTRVAPPAPDALPYAYYYVDDVSLVKTPPILPVPDPDYDLEKIELVEGKTIPLKNIFFEFDKWELMPRSYVELKKLLKIMRENPEMVIEVRGHTDDMGDDAYNLPLSEKRAKAVVDYLVQNGIAPERATFRGLGSSQPVAGNDSPEGRQLNRRVEFFIVRKEESQ